MLTNQLFEQHIGTRNGRRENNDLSRLLAAAVVSKPFCAMLLSDPIRAINSGYAGEQFKLSAEEYQVVISAKGTSLPEFAQHICKLLPSSLPAPKPTTRENIQVRL